MHASAVEFVIWLLLMRQAQRSWYCSIVNCNWIGKDKRAEAENFECEYVIQELKLDWEAYLQTINLRYDKCEIQATFIPKKYAYQYQYQHQLRY
jgi:hypothetical protein